MKRATIKKAFGPKSTANMLNTSDRIVRHSSASASASKAKRKVPFKQACDDRPNLAEMDAFAARSSPSCGLFAWKGKRPACQDSSLTASATCPMSRSPPHAGISTKQSEHGIFGKVIHRNGHTGEETKRVRHSHRSGRVHHQ